MDVVALVEEVFAPRAAVGHQQGRRVRDARLRDEPHGVLVQRHDRVTVLRSRVAIDDGGQVHLEVEPALDRRHQTELLRRHDDPLPLLAVAGHVHLDRVDAVELAVAPQRLLGVLETLEVLVPEHAGTGVEDARPEDFSGLHEIGVREHVGRRGLGVAGRRHAPREVGEVLPHLRFVDAPGRPRVRVDVDEPRDDGLAGHVDDPRTSRHRAPRADRHDAIVRDDDVAVVDDLVTLHGDDARTTQDHGAARNVPRDADRDIHPLRFVGRLFGQGIRARLEALLDRVGQRLERVTLQRIGPN